jgi:YVTN family beta-propeller protein
LNIKKELPFTTALLLSLVSHPNLYGFQDVSAPQQPAQAVYTLPNGRTITPVGKWIPTAPYPFAVALSPDQQQVVLPAIGWPFSLNIVDQPTTAEHIRRIPEDKKNAAEVQVHTGVVYSPHGDMLYDATGDTGAVDVLSTATWNRIARIELDGQTANATYAHSFSAVVALSADGRWLYVLDQGNWRIVVIDTASRKRVASLPTGANPFSLCLSPDGRQIYITNSGLFEYQLVHGVDTKDLLHTGLEFPPSGYPSKRARKGAVIEGHVVPGLGDENSDQGSSLWTYGITDPVHPQVHAKLRLGSHINEASKGAIGGAAPAGVVADAQAVYVALAHEDSIAVISPDGSRVEAEIPLSPFHGRAFEDHRGRPLRGVMPSGLALHQSRLYVTEAGINAVGVIDTAAKRVLGHLPVGWNPSSVAVSADGFTLYVANTKGKGTGPNGGSAFTNGGKYIGELETGSLSVVRVSPVDDLTSTTAQVVKNNLAATSGVTRLPNIRHVFLIIRENRTFDEVFGDLPGANGDAALARYGLRGRTEENPDLHDANVTPNAHALAGRFGTSDNFFVDSDVSADGHRWVVGIAPSPWMNIAWTSGYGGRRKEDPASLSPGRRALGGGADAPMPEDEPEFGSLWEHVASSNLRLRNYGEGLEVEGNSELAGSEPSGQRLALNSPVPNAIYESTDRLFPTFNLGIPDQYRFEEFKKDFQRVLLRGDTPALVVIRLPGDHTASPRPADGYPYRASYVADNDLALGKIMDFISHSSIWRESAVFVTEDDAQGGVDHVDAHRSVLLAMSPYIRNGAISHRRSSMVSIQKTMYELLGLGPLNLEDALSADLGDMFTQEPDFTPFTVVPSDYRIFDPAKARLARPKTAAEARALLDCDDSREIAKEFHKKSRPRTKSAAVISPGQD